jgi:hypothetical protein
MKHLIILIPFLSILCYTLPARAVEFPTHSDRGQPSRTAVGGTRAVECKGFCPPVEDGTPDRTESGGTRVW